jgi:hypothetical protein
MATRAELSSLSTILDELVGRVSLLTEGLSGEERDQLLPDLFEVERALRGARRRLSQIVDSASR